VGIREYFGAGIENLVGLDVGSSSVKVAVISSRGGKNPRLEYYRRQILPPGSIVENSIHNKHLVAQTIENLFPVKRFRRHRIATALSSDSVILKKLLLPNHRDAEIPSSVRWEIAQQFPGELDEMNCDYSVLNERRGDRPLEILLVAARKEKIAELNEVIRMAGLKPAVVDVDALVLHNLYLFTHDSSETEVEAVLNVGARITNVNILRGDSLLLTRYLLAGGNRYDQHVQEQSGLPSIQAFSCVGPEGPFALSDRANAIRDTINRSLALEIKKIFTYFKTTFNTPRIEAIRMCGGGSHIPGLPESLSQLLELPVYTLDPIGNLDSKYVSTEANSALAIGLALRLLLRK